MKNTILLVLFALLFIFLTSCSIHDYSDTYFIHAVGFEKTDDKYKIHAVCEKLQEKEDDYFVVTKDGDSIIEATNKLMNDYRDCYFATAELYFIQSDSDSDLINHLAEEICDSNIYPSKSFILGTKGNLRYFLTRIKSKDDLKEISKLTEKKKTNAVKYFAHFMSGKDINLIQLSINNNGKITVTDTKDERNEKSNK